jgi:hypothetical protein
MDIRKSEYKKRAKRTICLPVTRKKYVACIFDDREFRALIIETVKVHPELFPAEIEKGFKMKDKRQSAKQGLVIRRIIVGSIAWSIRPSFMMPYMTAGTENVEKALFMRKFAVPFWAIAYSYGRDPMFWFRISQSIGRHRVLATTIRNPDDLPEDLAADEKHTRLMGEKHYIATVVANEIVLSVDVSASAGTEDLTEAYGVFQKETKALNSDYTPKSVNIDGWKATMQAWKGLFPGIRIVLCFLHVFIGIRDRCSKKYRSIFSEVADKLWDCYRADTKKSFSQRVRRLKEWTQKMAVPQLIVEKIEKLGKKLPLYSSAYDSPGAHRTSNMLDRLMQRMDRHLFDMQFFHGEKASANRSIRSWALVQNFAPSNPNTVKKYQTFDSPADRFNRFSYPGNWLENLQISASRGIVKIGSP